MEENSLQLSLDSTGSSENVAEPTSPSDDSKPVSEQTKERKKAAAYVNPDRVKTGGTQREKLSDQELAERMERMRLQNEKIKQRRVDVQADEDAFRKSQEFEKAKNARTRKVQESVDNAREMNAKRKMDKIQSREWDSGKPSVSEWKERKSQEGDNSSWARGRGSPRGRGGRGRGARRGGTPSATSEPSSQEQETLATGTESTEPSDSWTTKAEPDHWGETEPSNDAWTANETRVAEAL